MDPDVGARTIHALIEAQVERTPDRVAIVSPARKLTYLALNEEANRLARVIVACPDTTDVPIIIGCPLGPAHVIATLAALKAGRFVVAINLTDPVARNQSIVRSLAARTIVVDGSHRALALETIGNAGSVIDVDAPREFLRGDNPLGVASPVALARIVLTSGSTGEPKGIMQSHRSTLHGAITRNNAVHFGSDDGMLIGTSMFTELWRPLLIGATLYLIDFRRDDMNVLRRWIHRERITTLRATPSVFRQLVGSLALRGSGDSSPGLNVFPTLRAIELMGEPMSWECVQLFQRHFSRECILVNFLGAKEVLDYCAYYVDCETEIGEGAVPAGYPLDGVDVDLLDETGKHAAAGSLGEIAVKSPSMSPGYWQNPVLTDARFRRDLVEDHSRTYLTGDRGQWVPDHGLLYLGRRDSVVKVRGHRVDVMQLEALIRDLPDVDDAAVVATTIDAQEIRLVAFIVARDGEKNVERDVRRDLGLQVPDSMMPSEIVVLDAMPMTAMGKIDRESLRATGATPRRPAGIGQSPRTEIERELAAAWASVLDIERVSVQDNFFELGGNSLMVMQVCARIQQLYAIDLPLSLLFERPTVALLAPLVLDRLRGPRVPGPGP